MLEVCRKHPAVPYQYSAKSSGDETTIATRTVVKTGAAEGPDAALPRATVLCQGPRQRGGGGGFSMGGMLGQPVVTKVRSGPLTNSPQDPRSDSSLPATLYGNKRDNQATSKGQPSTNMSAHGCLHCCAQCHCPQVETHVASRNSPSPCVPEAGRKNAFWGGLSPSSHLAAVFVLCWKFSLLDL